MDDLNNLVFAAAAILFVIALGSLLVWAFRTYVDGHPNSTASYGRATRA